LTKFNIDIHNIVINQIVFPDGDCKMCNARYKVIYDKNRCKENILIKWLTYMMISIWFLCNYKMKKLEEQKNWKYFRIYFYKLDNCLNYEYLINIYQSIFRSDMGILTFTLIRGFFVFFWHKKI